ncbi:hypothetical protein VTN31DRAFT_3790 [Thermomyces dupontii]|uniref:uncharacterized protein n=1 Tax=Talaromyces thermophilus TaxID=28565 RepID=UPI003741F690
MAGDVPFTSSLATEEPPKALDSHSKSLKRLNWSSRVKDAQKDISNKVNWRDKFFNKEREAKLSEEAARQVDDFLNSGRQAAQAATPAQTTEEPAQRPSPPTLSRSESDQTYRNAVPKTRKKPRRPDLRVTFTDQPPEVIGEGGDEAEEPTMEISRKRHRRDGSRSSPQKGYEDLSQRRPTLPQLHIDTSFDKDDGRSASNSTPTPLLLSPQDQDLLMSLSGTPGARISFRASPDSNSFAKRIQARMQQEEARALQRRLDLEGMSPTGDPEEDSPQQETLPLRPSKAAQPSHQPSSPPRPAEQARPGVHHLVRGLREDRESVDLSSPASSHASASPLEDRQPTLPVLEPPGGRFEKGRKPLSSSAAPPPASTQASAPAKTAAPAPAPEASRTKTKMTLRNAANAMGDSAYNEFVEFVDRFCSLYELAAESVKPLMETSLGEWVRASAWWFLKGRGGLEAAVRSGRSPEVSVAEQAVIDLGKAWWISERIIPQHSEFKRYSEMGAVSSSAVANMAGDTWLAGLIHLHQKIMSHLRALAVSMKRNNVLVTLNSTAQGDHQSFDTTIWVRYPFFAPDVSAIISGATRRSMLIDVSAKLAHTPDLMLLGDSSRYFSYGSMFVEMSVTWDDDYDSPQYSIPCVLCIKRERSDWYVLASLASQSELVNITIQSDRKQGPTWDDVEWQVETRTMLVKLRRGLQLSVAFQEKDFKMLWNIVRYTLKTEASLEPEAGETKIFEDTLKVFQYIDSATPKAFPPEPSPGCRVCLFERTVTLNEGTGRRKAHRGFRLAVVTNPQTKTLSSVRQLLGYDAPIVFGYLRGEDGAPALLLKFKDEARTWSMVLTFEQLSQRTTMHSLLVGMVPGETEFSSPDMQMKSYSVDQPPAALGGPGVNYLQFGAGTVSVIDQEPAYVEHGYGSQVLSEHLRVLVSTEWGTVTDRVNLGPGEMKIALDARNTTVLDMYRVNQEDLTVCVADNMIAPELPDKLKAMLQAAKTKPLIRRIEFANLQSLHSFQLALTGYNVIYDGIVSTFAISRRRSMVPIHKKWEANSARVQIVHQSQTKTVQLLAFFGSDFSHGHSMNFVVKGTDRYETFSRSNKVGVRIVDAKFALPKTGDESARFICLDMPEYPSEHDDINIIFESDQDRKRFLNAMPGTHQAPARVPSLRR